MTGELAYIWINGWDEFQSFQTKRGKPWAPPWIKIYPRLLDNPDYIELSTETRSLLLGLFILFARCRGTLVKDTRNLSHSLHQRVSTRQLERLNHAGFIDFCSGTVLEQRQSAFWNGSILEEEEEEEQKTPLPKPVVKDQPGNGNGGDHAQQHLAQLVAAADNGELTIAPSPDEDIAW